MKRFALLPFLLLLPVCSIAQRPAAASRLDSETTIYVVRRGWHIDVGFNRANIEAPLQSTLADFPSARYVFFGFGDKHYLVARHKNFPGLIAALWPGAGVLLATALAATPEEAFGDKQVVRFTVSSAQARAAQAFVWNSLLKQGETPVFLGNGPYPGSLFFGAVPKYSAAYTCNTWAAEDLQAAGLPVRSVGVVFAAQLWMQVRRIDAAGRTGRSADLTSFAALALLRPSANRRAHD
ncbi:MAG TPA: DUF2459 domain-containing protein [Steroidobacteraceae bacterium]|jgi:hypothetical protein|nr:DUF2459 domain-containing protein [Steroidobacteraceae bacterium]